MAITGEPRFRVGDRVLVRDGPNAATWTVVGHDTDRTPIVDCEPAYKLRSANGHITRYAYESDLVLDEQETA